MPAETNPNNTSVVEMDVCPWDEGTEASRSAQSVDAGDGSFQLEAHRHYDSQLEIWELIPGSVLISEWRSDESGKYRIAERPTTASSERH